MDKKNNINLGQMKKAMENADSADATYWEKAKFAKEASQIGPTKEELPFLRKHVARVYNIFALMLVYTGGIIWFLYYHPSLYLKILQFITHSSWTIWGSWGFLLLCIIICGFSENLLIKSISAFAFLTGISIISSSISFIYEPMIIFKALAVTIAIYIGTALFGLFTKKNLTGWGPPLFGALLGLIVAGLFQGYFHNSTLDFIVTLVDIVVFTLYIMYDNQMIKVRFLDKYRDNIPDSLASWWALSLDSSIDIYLDFINLFLDILSLFSSDDDD